MKYFELYDLEETFHTEGFFKRESSLMRALAPPEEKKPRIEAQPPKVQQKKPRIEGQSPNAAQKKKEKKPARPTRPGEQMKLPFEK